MGLLVAHKADMAHVGKGHELQQTVDHAEAGAQYGHDGEEVVLEDGEGGAADWRVDLAQLGGKVARDLVAHQDGDFLEKRPELRRGGVAIAHVGWSMTCTLAMVCAFRERWCREDIVAVGALARTIEQSFILLI